MKFGRVAMLSVFVMVMPNAVLAAPQPLKITIVSGQIIKACPKVAPVQEAVVCTKNIEVSGGAPTPAYEFSVKDGTTLPPGIKLIPATGIITATKDDPPLPAAGTKTIQVTVSDGVRSANGRLTLQMDTSDGCSCPGLTAGFGELPDAQGAQPYGIALPVSGPSSSDALRPAYTWSINCDGISPLLCKLPPGMKLDKSNGVLSGTPRADTAGHTFVFKVKIKEKKSNSTAVSPDSFRLDVN